MTRCCWGRKSAVPINWLRGIMLWLRMLSRNPGLTSELGGAIRERCRSFRIGSSRKTGAGSICLDFAGRNGFRCPRCGNSRAWPMGRRPFPRAQRAFETFLTAGTLFSGYTEASAALVSSDVVRDQSKARGERVCGRGRIQESERRASASRSSMRRTIKDLS